MHAVPPKSRKLTPEVRPTAALQFVLETLIYKTRERLELINITRDLNELIRKQGLRAGFIIVQSLHTTTAVFINEFQQALLDVIKSFLEKIVGRIEYWRHNDPKLSECERQNADSHRRAMLLGHTLSLPVRDGALALGTWQSIIPGGAGRTARTLHPSAGPRRSGREIAVAPNALRITTLT
jgi:secondary thiamine-phosphate synthase enzyme